MIVKCINKADADKVEGDLRYLHFIDERPNPIRWKRVGSTIVSVTGEMEDVQGSPTYVRQYLSKVKSRRII